MAAGIGFFLAHIGYQAGEGIGLVVADPATLVTLGECLPGSTNTTCASLAPGTQQVLAVLSVKSLWQHACPASNSSASAGRCVLISDVWRRSSLIKDVSVTPGAFASMKGVPDGALAILLREA